MLKVAVSWHDLDDPARRSPESLIWPRNRHWKRDSMSAIKHISISTANLSTAYHEAGHAVAAWRLNIPLRRKGVTIIPDRARGADGSIFHRQVVSKDIEYDRSNRNVLKAERLAQLSLAGEIAQRRYSPRGMRSYHSESDQEKAIDTLSYFAADARELEAWLKLLHIRTENMFSNPDVWRAVVRLVGELTRRGTICGREATEIIRLAFRTSESRRR